MFFGEGKEIFATSHGSKGMDFGEEKEISATPHGSQRVESGFPERKEFCENIRDNDFEVEKSEREFYKLRFSVSSSQGVQQFPPLSSSSQGAQRLQPSSSTFPGVQQFQSSSSSSQDAQQPQLQDAQYLAQFGEMQIPAVSPHGAPQPRAWQEAQPRMALPQGLWQDSIEVQEWITTAVQAILAEKSEVENVHRVREQVETLWRTQMREMEEVRI